MYPNSDHITPLIQAGRLLLMPDVDSVGVNDYLVSRLHWIGTSVDWRKTESVLSIPYSVIENGYDIAAPIGKCLRIAYYYSDAYPMLLGSREEMSDLLSVVYWKAPGLRFVFGVKDTGKLNLDVFLAWAGGDVVYCSESKRSAA